MEVAVREVAARVADAEDFRAWVAPHLVATGTLATRLSSAADGDDVMQESLSRLVTDPAGLVVVERNKFGS